MRLRAWSERARAGARRRLRAVRVLRPRGHWGAQLRALLRHMSAEPTPVREYLPATNSSAASSSSGTTGLARVAVEIASRRTSPGLAPAYGRDAACRPCASNVAPRNYEACCPSLGHRPHGSTLRSLGHAQHWRPAIGPSCSRRSRCPRFRPQPARRVSARHGLPGGLARWAWRMSAPISAGNVIGRRPGARPPTGGRRLRAPRHRVPARHGASRPM